ncbi:MAG: PAS domain S-box protein [Anaerolineales bacterium]|nr:MAG: PAS domain S-box protein [Anaerolineales bacterium]
MPPKKGKTASSAPSSMQGDSFEMLFKNHPIPMWVYDLETLAFLDVNDAAVKKYGYTHRQFLKMTLKDIRPAEDVPHLMEDIGKKRQPFQSSGPWRHQLKNGKIIDVEITSHTLEVEGCRCVLVMAQDVTERRRMETALQESEARYRDLVENSHDLICTHDLEGNLLSVNEAAVKLTGYPRKTLLRMNLKDALAPGGGRDFEAYLGKIQAQGRARGEMRVRIADGQIRIWEYDNSLRTEGVEKPIVRGMARDITERKQAEEAQRKAEIYHRSLFEQTQDAVFILDLEGHHLETNQRAADMLGYQIDEIKGLSVSDTSAEQGKSREVVRRLLNNELVAPYERIFRRKDGSKIPVEVNVELVKGEDGTPLYIQSVARDITERRQAQEALHESQMLFQQVWESTSDAMAISDPQGIVLAANPAYYDLYGYEPKLVIGGSFANIFGEEDRAWAVEQYKLAFSAKTAPASFKSIVRRADGSTRSIESRVTFLTSGGKRTAMLSTIRDITEQKQAQDALQQSEQLFKNAFQHSAIGMALVSPQGQWLKVNSRICSILGYSEGELLALTFQDITHPDDLDVDLKYVRQLLAGEIETYTMEKRYIRKNGGVVWALLAVALVKDNSGTPLYFISQVKDITERKQMVNELLKSEQRYRTLFDNTPAAIFEEDFSEVKKHLDSLKQQGVTDFRAYFNSHPEAVRECAGMIRVLDVNQTALKMYHAESREALLESMLVQSRGEQEHNHEDFIAIAEGRTSNSWEGADETLTGQPLEVNLSWSVTAGHEHDFSKAIVTSVDITERKRAEQALYESEEKLQNIIRHSSSLFYTHTADNVLVYVSQQAREILDCEPEEAMVHWQEFLSDNPLNQRGIESTEYAIRTGERQPSYQLELVTRKGRRIWVQVDESPMVRDGKTVAIVGSLTDITERKQAVDALRRTEAHLEEAQRIAHVGSWDWIAATDTPRWSKELCRILEIDPDKPVPSMTEQDKLYTPDSMVRMRAAVEKTLQNGEPYEIELERVRVDGSRRWLLARGERWLDERGELVGLHGTALDITERRQAEEKLRESEERYKSISEDMPAMVCRFKADGTLTFINSFYCEYFETPRDKLIGSNLFSLIPETERELVMGNYLSLNREKPYISYEYKTTDGRGGERWQRWTDRALFNEQGEIFEYQSIGEDITQRKQAENELKTSLSMLNASLESTADGILIVDRQGKITLWNQKFADMWKIPEEILADHDDAKTINYILNQLADPEQFISKVSTLYEQPEESSVDQIQFADGRVFERYSQPQTIGSKIEGRVWSFHDITERTQAEQEKQRLIRDLGERVKEVSFLHNVARIFMDYSRPEEEVLQDVINSLPSAWQHPEITRARITFHDREFATQGFRETAWMQTQFFDISDGKRGSIEVAYLEERPRGDDGPFMKEERRLLESLAEKLQTYMRGIQADRAINRQVTELETLYESGLAISRLHTPNQVAHAVIEILGRRMDWHHIAIREYEPRFNSVNLVGFHKPSLSAEEAEDHIQEMNGIITNSRQGLSGWVTLNGTSLRVPNVKTDERYVDVFPNILSGLYVPLKIGERVIGSISVESEAENAFTEHDQRLLETLAGQAAIAIENANLFTTLQSELIERRLIEAEVRHLNAELEERVRERTLQSEAAKRRLELATHAGQIGVWEYYPAENTVIWDERMHMIHHIPAGEFDGTPQAWAQSIHPDDLEKTGIDRQLEVTQDLLLNREHRIILPNGSVRHISTSSVTVFSDNGEAERVVGISVDITDRKQIEQALSASEAYARLLFDAAPDPVSVTEADGTVRDANRSFEQQHQLKRDEIRGRRISELGIFPAGESARLQDYNLAIMNGEKTPPVELTFHAPGDGRHVLEMHSYPVEVGGRRLVLSTSRDITTHKQAEEALRFANAEMENALRIKDEFLANMSHELRTPLNSIIGISESLEEQLVGGLNEKQEKYVRIVKESGHHLLDLINDILDISKIEAGRMELDLRAFSVEKLCQSSIRMVRELAQKKSLDVLFQVKGNVKIISGDERRLKQSLVNLLGNAVKFTETGKRIGLEVEGHPQRNEVTFTVWDEGIGIAQEDLQLLFKPFVQLDAGLTREYQGTGLGLALVAQMVRLHGGHVRVESEWGAGSRFIITLPWGAEEQNAEVKGTGELLPPHQMPAGKHSGSVLLVEDTEIIISLLKEFLTHRGYQVFIARNGRDGIQLAKSERPDLILMDIMMPMMDGLEAAKLLREDNDFKQVPIIAMTALAMPGDRERCLAAGMTDYMSKPIRIDELGKMIERYIPAEGRSNAEQNTDRG